MPRAASASLAEPSSTAGWFIFDASAAKYGQRLAGPYSAPGQRTA